MINEGYFLSVLHKNIYCGYSLESPQPKLPAPYPKKVSKSPG